MCLARELDLADGKSFAATVFDLLVANYGIDRGLGGENVANSYDEDVPYTPAWQQAITGVAKDRVIAVARQFAKNAEKTEGRSTIILGAGLEPLVPHGHELPRHHQSGGDVRLRGQARRRLGALCRAGKAAAADRLDAACICAGLGASAAAHECDLLLVRSHQSMEIRTARPCSEILSPFADPGQWKGQPDRFQCSRRADGMAAVIAAARPQSAGCCPRCESGRTGSARLCRAAAQARQARRSPARTPTTPQTGRAICSSGDRITGRQRQGPRILSQAPARCRQRRAQHRSCRATGR